MNQPDMNEPDIEHRLRDAIETIIGSAPYALCFDATPTKTTTSNQTNGPTPQARSSDD